MLESEMKIAFEFFYLLSLVQIYQEKSGIILLFLQEVKKSKFFVKQTQEIMLQKCYFLCNRIVHL